MTPGIDVGEPTASRIASYLFDDRRTTVNIYSGAKVEVNELDGTRLEVGVDAGLNTVKSSELDAREVIELRDSLTDWLERHGRADG